MNMTCGHVRDMIQRQMDGDVLAPYEQEALAAHLGVCADCRAFARDLECLTGVVEHLPPVSAPAALVGRVMAQVPAPQTARAPLRWFERIGHAWALLAGLVGLLLLIDQTAAVHGVSLLNLPNAVAEWLSMIDLSHLESLLQATSLFAWSVGIELLLGISLVMVAVFAMMAQAITRPPTMGLPARR